MTASISPCCDAADAAQPKANSIQTKTITTTLRVPPAWDSPYGVYFFSQATSEQEALEEAEYVLNLINGAGVTYPVVYDQEPVTDSSGRANNLSADQLTKNAQTFCKRIEQAGYTPMVYGNQYDLSRLNIDQINAAVWYAEYTDTHPNSNYHDFVMWQYSHTGKVNGIKTDVDMDIPVRGQLDQP